MTDFLARQERFAVVGSTNDVVHAWLADGTLEVCLAVADEQTAGRGRDGRTWLASSGGALLLSLGFRPGWLAPERVWRLAACVSLAMADAAEVVAGLPRGAVRLKWPNDLVVETVGAVLPPSGVAPTEVRKLAGVLGETEGLGTGDQRAVVGIGIDVDWAAADFPPELATRMTSLREAAGGRPVDRDTLLHEFLDRLEARVDRLRGGRFDVADWTDRQVTTGREIAFAGPDGRIRGATALGIDAASGALVIDDADDPSGERAILVGEIRQVRLAANSRSTPADDALASETPDMIGV